MINSSRYSTLIQKGVEKINDLKTRIEIYNERMSQLETESLVVASLGDRGAIFMAEEKEVFLQMQIDELEEKLEKEKKAVKNLLKKLEEAINNV